MINNLKMPVLLLSLAGCGGGGPDPVPPSPAPSDLGCSTVGGIPHCCGCGLDLPPPEPWVPIVIDTTDCLYVGDANLTGDGGPSEIWACGLTCGTLTSDGLALSVGCQLTEPQQESQEE